jgi:hypothetical protein
MTWADFMLVVFVVIAALGVLLAIEDSDNDFDNGAW